MTRALEQYVRSGRTHVGGWFAKIDADIFRVLMDTQAEFGLGGAGAEIGVHHGKAFIAICLGLEAGERAWCVDVFDDQALNRDKSGQGDRGIFEANLSRFGVDLGRIDIRRASSADVQPQEILDAVGPVRLFSVDGGHWHDIVVSDLRLADAVLAPHGVIALDDFCHPAWPEVSAAYFTWARSSTRALVPFALGFNKLYLTARDYAAPYQRAILNDRALKPFMLKWGELDGVRLPIFHLRLEPPLNISAYCRVMHPRLYGEIATLLAPSRSMLRKLKHKLKPTRQVETFERDAQT